MLWHWGVQDKVGPVKFCPRLETAQFPCSPCSCGWHTIKCHHQEKQHCSSNKPGPLSKSKYQVLNLGLKLSLHGFFIFYFSRSLLLICDPTAKCAGGLQKQTPSRCQCSLHGGARKAYDPTAELVGQITIPSVVQQRTSTAGCDNESFRLISFLVLCCNTRVGPHKLESLECTTHIHTN